MSVAILVLLVIRIAPLAHAMATTSLWQDEFYSIDRFSSQGVLVSLTDYHVPNNHVLFNALNALLPNADSAQPLRARLVSFLSVVASLLVLAGYFFRRRRPLDGALCAVFIFNGGCLSLTLQARGYGLLTLFAVLASLSCLELCRTRSGRALLVLATSTVLGTWTVPVFLVFAGPLILILFLCTADRRVFWTGLATLGAVLLVNLPILAEMMDHSQGYAEQWGRRYASLQAVASTIRFYLPARTTPEAMAVLAATLMAPSWVPRRARSVGLGLRILALGVVVFFLACLQMTTPLIRTTAFVAIPMSIILVVAGGEIWRRRGCTLLRPAVLAISLVAMSVYTVHGLRVFSFVPLENWKETAEIVEQTFPDDLPLYVNFRRNHLRKYLVPPIREAADFTPQFFRAGRQVFIDTSKDLELKAALRQEADDSRGLISVPQKYGQAQMIMFHPPRRSRVDSATFEGETLRLQPLTDRSRATSWMPRPIEGSMGPSVGLTLGFESSEPLRSSVLLWGDCPLPTSVAMTARSSSESEEIRGGDPQLVRRFDDVIVVPLGDRELRSIHLEFELPEGSKGPCLDEIWAYPVRDSPN